MCVTLRGKPVGGIEAWIAPEVLLPSLASNNDLAIPYIIAGSWVAGTFEEKGFGNVWEEDFSLFSGDQTGIRFPFFAGILGF